MGKEVARTEIPPGTLYMLILRSLARLGPMHGYGIAQHIQQLSEAVLQVEEGSLYPALHRMEQERWIVSEWGVSENNRRARFYSLTAAGTRQLKAETAKWTDMTAVVAGILAKKADEI